MALNVADKCDQSILSNSQLATLVRHIYMGVDVREHAKTIEFIFKLNNHFNETSIISDVNFRWKKMSSSSINGLLLN